MSVVSNDTDEVDAPTPITGTGDGAGPALTGRGLDDVALASLQETVADGNIADLIGDESSVTDLLSDFVANESDALLESYSSDAPEPAAETAETAAAEPESVDEDETLITIQRDGDDLTVPLDDLIANFEFRTALESQRDALVAREAQFAEREQAMQDLTELANALGADPAGTMTVLAERLGVAQTLAQRLGAANPVTQPAIPAQQPQQPPVAADPYWDDQPQQVQQQAQPDATQAALLQTIQQMSDRLQRLEGNVNETSRAVGQVTAMERDRALRAQFDSYSNEVAGHGVTYDEVRTHMSNNGIGDIKAAFHDLAYPRIVERAKLAASQAEQRRADARGQQQLAAPVVGRGTATLSAPPPPPAAAQLGDSTGNPALDQAILASVQELRQARMRT